MGLTRRWKSWTIPIIPNTNGSRNGWGVHGGIPLILMRSIAESGRNTVIASPFNTTKTIKKHGYFSSKNQLRKVPMFFLLFALKTPCNIRTFGGRSVSNYAWERLVQCVISQFPTLHKPPRAVFTIFAIYVCWHTTISKLHTAPTTSITLAQIKMRSRFRLFGCVTFVLYLDRRRRG